MTDTTVEEENEEYHGEEDRLPWLETVDEDYEEGTPVWRIILLVLLGLAVIAAAVFGYIYYKRHSATDGNGALINAQEGNYKVKPDQAGGMKVGGEGDSRFVTSEGGASNGSVDVSALPETPVQGKRAPNQTGGKEQGSARVVAAVPPAKKVGTAPKPANNGAGAGGGGGSVIQLGSFPNESGANSAWSRLSKRFSYLAPLGKSVQKASVNGNTVYRLRVNTGSTAQAKELCGKLKVAGEACYIPAD